MVKASKLTHACHPFACTLDMHSEYCKQTKAWAPGQLHNATRLHDAFSCFSEIIENVSCQAWVSQSDSEHSASKLAGQPKYKGNNLQMMQWWPHAIKLIHTGACNTCQKRWCHKQQQQIYVFLNKINRQKTSTIRYLYFRHYSRYAPLLSGAAALSMRTSFRRTVQSLEEVTIKFESTGFTWTLFTCNNSSVPVIVANLMYPLHLVSMSTTSWLLHPGSSCVAADLFLASCCNSLQRTGTAQRQVD